MMPSPKPSPGTNPGMNPPSSGASDGEPPALFTGLLDSLPAEDRQLLESARAILPRAHCPYSRFRVGAALRAASGEVFSGVNLESASFGLTICAERSALAVAVAAGVREVVAVAVATEGPGPVTPCGACRQFLAEFGKDMRVISAGAGDRVMVHSMGELLPHPFLDCPPARDSNPAT